MQSTNVKKPFNNNAQRKSITKIAGNILTDPGLAFITAHVMLAVATGGWGLGISLTSLSIATGLKAARELEIHKKIKHPLLKKILSNEDTPIRMAGIGLIALSALSFSGGFWMRGGAFLLFSAGDFLYNTKLSKKFPLDNLCFTGAGCVTTFLAGASLFPMAMLGTGFALSTYNLFKPSGDRNFLRPKLWAGAAAGLAAILGFASGHPEQFMPSLAMVSVFYSYFVCMEAKANNWGGKIKNTMQKIFKNDSHHHGSSDPKKELQRPHKKHDQTTYRSPVSVNDIDIGYASDHKGVAQKEFENTNPDNNSDHTSDHDDTTMPNSPKAQHRKLS